VSVTWEFAPNDYFHDEKLEKKFWYRRARDGWCGLVSEPVDIKWKEGRDLTGGLLGLVCKAWEVEQKSLDTNSKSNGKAKKGGLTPEQKILKRKIENTGMGGLSFFAWFGFIGRKVSEEESREATKIEREKREKRKAAKSSPEAASNAEEDQDDEEDEEDIDMSLEIFPDGDDLAISITEDLWPGAIKYFSKSDIHTSHLPHPLSSPFITKKEPYPTKANPHQLKHKNKTPFQTPISNPTTKKKKVEMPMRLKTRIKAKARTRTGRRRNRDLPKPPSIFAENLIPQIHTTRPPGSRIPKISHIRIPNSLPRRNVDPISSSASQNQFSDSRSQS